MISWEKKVFLTVIKCLAQNFMGKLSIFSYIYFQENSEQPHCFPQAPTKIIYNLKAIRTYASNKSSVHFLLFILKLSRRWHGKLWKVTGILFHFQVVKEVFFAVYTILLLPLAQFKHTVSQVAYMEMKCITIKEKHKSHYSLLNVWPFIRWKKKKKEIHSTKQSSGVLYCLDNTLNFLPLSVKLKVSSWMG